MGAVHCALFTGGMPAHTRMPFYSVVVSVKLSVCWRVPCDSAGGFAHKLLSGCGALKNTALPTVASRVQLGLGRQCFLGTSLLLQLPCCPLATTLHLQCFLALHSSPVG